MRTRAPLWALLLLAVLCACARNPVSGRPEVVLVSKSAEKDLGAEAAKEVEATQGIVPDEALQAYVQRIGARLAAHSPRQDVEYKFAVVDMKEPNAFALPGGYVYVSRGLLATAMREDEVAAVIGHEIGHVAGRHSVQQVTTATPFAIVLGLPAAIVGVVSKSLGSVLAFPGKVTSGLVLAKRSRAQESEADRTGMDLTAKAGWDPSALADILARMERISLLKHDGKAPKSSYFDSHPSTDNRVSQVDALAAQFQRAEAAPIAGTPETFFGTLEGLLLEENPKEGAFVDHAFLHPMLGFRIDFPPAWTTQNQATHVLAVDPESDGHTFALLQISTASEDPLDGARSDGLHKRLLDQVQKGEIHGLPAAMLQTEKHGSAYRITWIAHRGSIYRISAVARAADTEAAAVLETVAPSFRPLAADDLARIPERRLRIATASDGEDLGALYERAASVWSTELGALYNDVESGAPLQAGQVLKLAHEEHYHPE